MTIRTSRKVLIWGALLNSIAVPLPFLLLLPDTNIDGITEEFFAVVAWGLAMAPIIAGLLLCAAMKKFGARILMQRGLFCLACLCTLVPLGLSLLQFLVHEPAGQVTYATYAMSFSFISGFLLIVLAVLWVLVGRRTD